MKPQSCDCETQYDNCMNEVLRDYYVNESIYEELKLFFDFTGAEADMFYQELQSQSDSAAKEIAWELARDIIVDFSYGEVVADTTLWHLKSFQWGAAALETLHCSLIYTNCLWMSELNPYCDDECGN